MDPSAIREFIREEVKIQLHLRDYQPQPPKSFKKRASLWDCQLALRSDKGVGRIVLHGRVYDHPSFYNGEKVTTSPILRLDIPGKVAETMHTVYDLQDGEKPS